MGLFLNMTYYYRASYNFKMSLTNTIIIFGIILSRVIENNPERIARISKKEVNYEIYF
ncbi:hypothetical protein HMPREF9225_0609 [Peptoniphilus duerdenii ATCC BAA-1640]|uniref:Uncharacterized protein n=1 Tax=Peptoniphilus duerdenii ATCC BAA-1640 TaxID=862517 RepID=E0NKC0_9FIRM|nr:hypothetical protein HMPREF9225_0609 [Peptoniphilus duerdenii ATCC BAA-1640]